ncbi:maleylacetoacetate isomerase [Hirschia baltica]|uniref:Maleylacetoacetate isomerase n=1 Tax=Hirschia baltica (strain ATCC 49814 / DSM 5838 / IFAM 1418) TaxID=582402 RepID=C6XPP8_HIRBI|nr:maleylacetoacetate isomerase [Hirschia baltica]ACT60313.1 maleylacetoacetate isomerase [Hirschia baltica ATCC 49814]
MTSQYTLHGFFRSGASYRVRIALNLKGVSYEQFGYKLRKNEQNSEAFLKLNPQGFVPALESNDTVLTQSLAICEYLDEIIPTPKLLPDNAIERARVRAFSQVIACDIHPIQNLKILQRLSALGLDEDQVNAWAATTINEGLDACEALIKRQSGPFCFGEDVTLADVCLIPQLVNARRFGASMKWERLMEIEAKCLTLDAFKRAMPENQPDAV